jgi:two-component system response regulator FixJ
MKAQQPSVAATAASCPIYIIDDDASVRVALERLLIAAGIRVRAFPSADAFLASGAPIEGACIILDVMMHGLSGLDLCQTLKARKVRANFIFVTAHDTPEARQRARDAGAIAYFRKPVDDRALIDAIEWARGRVGA